MVKNILYVQYYTVSNATGDTVADVAVLACAGEAVVLVDAVGVCIAVVFAALAFVDVKTLLFAPVVVQTLGGAFTFAIPAGGTSGTLVFALGTDFAGIAVTNVGCVTLAFFDRCT